jgi:hypothetical protein
MSSSRAVTKYISNCIVKTCSESCSEVYGFGVLIPRSLLRGSSCVPGMFRPLKGASPFANLMEVKAREAQGRHREVGSEGSVDQRCEPTNRNWIGGVSAGRVSVRSRSPYPSRANDVHPAVVHRQGMNLPREACGVSGADRGPSRTKGPAMVLDRTPGVSRGHRRRQVALKA